MQGTSSGMVAPTQLTPLKVAAFFFFFTVLVKKRRVHYWKGYMHARWTGIYMCPSLLTAEVTGGDAAA